VGGGLGDAASRKVLTATTSSSMNGGRMTQNEAHAITERLNRALALSEEQRDLEVAEVFSSVTGMITEVLIHLVQSDDGDLIRGLRRRTFRLLLDGLDPKSKVEDFVTCCMTAAVQAAREWGDGRPGPF